MILRNNWWLVEIGLAIPNFEFILYLSFNIVLVSETICNMFNKLFGWNVVDIYMFIYISSGQLLQWIVLFHNHFLPSIEQSEQ